MQGHTLYNWFSLKIHNHWLSLCALPSSQVRYWLWCSLEICVPHHEANCPFRKTAPHCCKRHACRWLLLLIHSTAEDHLSCTVGRIPLSQLRKIIGSKKHSKILDSPESSSKKWRIATRNIWININKSLQIQKLHSKLWLLLLSSARKVVPTFRSSWRATLTALLVW